ncbi:MAG: choice-of-anchor J domain-containing protein, partial [Candidatus Krumholzibacteria bacterium]|nr:choice-of-anchor J domain-containing protein [Candidatus Krumholzibacteria bacterium]
MMTGRKEDRAMRGRRSRRTAAHAVCLTLLMIVTMSVSAIATELVINSGFEAGDFSGGWVDGAGNVMGPLNPNWADHAVLLEMPYTGNYSALLGFKYTMPQQHRYGFMHYDVAIPIDISSATLSFQFRHMGYDGEGRDPFNVEIRDLGGGTLATVLTHTFPERTGVFKESGWFSFSYDMSAYAGQTVRIYFEQLNDIDNNYETWVYVDDVSLEAAGWVDLIVDSDGDDLFGAPGSGAGGASAQSTEVDRSLSYFVDIENEGQVDDSYDLSLTLPAGWTAVARYGGTDYPFPWTTPIVTA